MSELSATWAAGTAAVSRAEARPSPRRWAAGLQAFARGTVLSVSCSGEEARRGRLGGGGREDGPVTVAPSSDWARTGRVGALPENLLRVCNERMPFRFFYIGLPH